MLFRSSIRLTVDLLPEIRVIVHREGESVAAAIEEAEMLAEAEAVGEPVQLEYLEALDEASDEAETAGEVETEGDGEDREEAASEDEESEE